MSQRQTAPAPTRCDREDCYFHQHYGPGCKATLIVVQGHICQTYCQLIGGARDHA